MQISGNFMSQLEISDVEASEEGSNLCGTENDSQPLDALDGIRAPTALGASAAAAGEVISFQAVVAVDTDNEWMDGFSDDPDAALEWITDLFLAMNVFYERDIETHLLLGDVILRTAPDPYTIPSDRYQQLNEFGEYWMENMSQIDRQFALLLSGRSINSGSFSGIAWINQYCDYGRRFGNNVAGSYSYNAIGSRRTAGNTALYVGHEIGHNMGSVHTHCYDPPVDQCYSGEGGCYSGNPACPAGGKGTVMSYCHVGGADGAGCGTSNQEFHPTVQSLLEGRLADEMAAGCIAPFASSDPEPEFAAIPAGSSTLDFGTQVIGTQSDPREIRVDNLGDSDLTLNCGLSGTGSASFDVSGCQGPVRPGENISVSLTCEPASTGPLTATLSIQTNDSDESQVDYDLECDGVETVPPDDRILSEGFEST